MYGGIGGYVTSYSKIVSCYNTGIISSSTAYAGGISGYTYTCAIIEFCYNTGDVSTTNNIVGGITAYIRDNAQINKCYSTGAILGAANASGVVGHVNIGQIKDCYYLENTVNLSNDTTLRDGVSKKTSEELKNIFINNVNEFKEDVNGINNGYPILSWQ